MELIKSAARHIRRGLTLQDMALRAVVAVLLSCFFELITADAPFYELDYMRELPFAAHLLRIGAVFVALVLLHLPILDRVLLFLAAFLYCAAAIYMMRDIYLLMVGCAILGGVTVFCVKENTIIKLKASWLKLLLGGMMLLFFAFVGGLTVLRYKSFTSSCYDFGIFSQMFHYMRETLQPLVTCERDKLLSHFAVHASPIYYLMLPFYAIFPTPSTLLVCQAALLASGAIPLYLICKHYELSNAATFGICFCYLMLPSLSGGAFYFLHENKFLTPLLLWLMFAFEKKKTVLIFVFALLVLLVKEDAPVYVAVLALYYILSKQQLKKSIPLFILACIYFVAVVLLLGKYGEGVMNYRYDNFLYDPDGNLFTVIKAAILNPIYVFSESVNAEKFVFLMQMLLPLGFLPFMTKKPSRLILLIPLLLVNLMSDYYYQHDIGYQYTYGTAAFLIYLLVMNYKELMPAFRRRVLPVAMACALLCFVVYSLPRLSAIPEYRNNQARYAEIETGLSLVPHEASVRATTYLVPNLYNHDVLYEIETTQHDTEYIVLDLRAGMEHHNKYYRPHWETVYFIEGAVAVYRNPLYINS